MNGTNASDASGSGSALATVQRQSRFTRCLSALRLRLGRLAPITTGEHMRHRSQVEREREIAERTADRRRHSQGNRMLEADMICRRYLDAAEQQYGPERGGVTSVTFDEHTGWHTIHFQSGTTKKAHGKDLLAAAAMMYAAAHARELGGSDDHDSD